MPLRWSRPCRDAFQSRCFAEVLGRFTEAEAAYEACIRCDPRYWRAHSALAATRGRRRSVTTSPGWNGCSTTGPLEVDAELRLRHALAKELEDLGRDDEAFAHLLVGNARKHATTGYRFERDQSLFDAVTHLFPEVLPAPAHADRTGDEIARAPIFVVGMPRTGTTLVERILSSHSQVASAGEWQNFGVLLQRACRTPSPQVLDEATLAQSLRVDLQALGRDYVERTRPPGPGATALRRQVAAQFFLPGRIADALPAASIVVLRRHPARYRAQQFPPVVRHRIFVLRNTRETCATSAGTDVQFDRLIAHWQATLPGRVHEVRYEALVADQRAETGRLLAHCRLPWEEACLPFRTE